MYPVVLSSFIRRPSLLVLPALAICALLLAGACGGGGDDGGSGLSGAKTRLQQVIPEATEFTGDVFIRDGTEDEVNLVIKSTLENEPRIHVVSDTDAIKGAELVDEINGTQVYLTSATYWADLSESGPLFASAREIDGLRTYLSFYEDGEPGFSDQRFWDVYEYARDRFTKELGAEATLLRVSYVRDWRDGFDGIRLQAWAGEEQVYMAVLLHGLDTVAASDEFDTETVDDFSLRFAVPELSEEIDDLPAWDFAVRAWFAAGDEIV
jgi:hypothetical protein